ncbi:MAG: hypothetical protein GY772_28270, partial [bacterium]|nr:hypothetical protein [bacterium]
MKPAGDGDPSGSGTAGESKAHKIRRLTSHHGLEVIKFVPEDTVLGGSSPRDRSTVDASTSVVEADFRGDAADSAVQPCDALGTDRTEWFDVHSDSAAPHGETAEDPQAAPAVKRELEEGPGRTSGDEAASADRSARRVRSRRDRPKAGTRGSGASPRATPPRGPAGEDAANRDGQDAADTSVDADVAADPSRSLTVESTAPAALDG